jgi:hypothetical protein
VRLLAQVMMPEHRTDDSSAAYMSAYHAVGSNDHRPVASVQPVRDTPMNSVPKPYAYAVMVIGGYLSAPRRCGRVSRWAPAGWGYAKGVPRAWVRAHQGHASARGRRWP